MSNLTKEEVSQWIRNLMPYLENPMALAPKGCLEGDIKPKPGKVIEYDACLMPNAPEILSQEENIKALVELYKAVENDQKE